MVEHAFQKMEQHITVRWNKRFKIWDNLQNAMESFLIDKYRSLTAVRLILDCAFEHNKREKCEEMLFDYINTNISSI